VYHKTQREQYFYTMLRQFLALDPFCAGGDYVPIIFITGDSREEYLQYCIDAEGDDFIYKPINELVLKAKVNSLLRVRQLYQQQYSQKQQLLEYQHKMDQEQEILVAASIPFIFGIRISKTTRSGLSFLKSCNASLPSSLPQHCIKILFTLGFMIHQK
jgi:response regulator RpfG family c-di-GMP phosphodiesterase